MILTSDLSVQIQGLRLSDQDRRGLYRKLRRLYEESPDQSSLEARLHNREGRLQAQITIHSLTGSFFAESEGYDYGQVIEELETLIREKLSLWKVSRFSSPARTA